MDTHDQKKMTEEEKRLILVDWSENYAVGIELIDTQHRELVNLTNELYRACMDGDKTLGTAFKDVMGRMVSYVRFHFTVELALLERINYPEYQTHKTQHEQLVKQILESAKKYEKGNRIVPYQFVIALKDWVFGHIAICDKKYAAYVRTQKSKGLLTDKLINGE